MAAKQYPSVPDSTASRIARRLREAASRKCSGFTLVELIVVITVLAILATVGFLALSGYTQDARDSALKANVRSVVSAISSESALTGNSPRYYVIHDTGAALTGAFVYVDGLPVALTGGSWDADGTNYSAGNPDYAKLKLNADKFKVATVGSGLPFSKFLPRASAAYDPVGRLSVGALDYSSSATASGRRRSSSFLQVAWINPATKAVTVLGNFPGTSLSGSAAGLVKDPASASSTGALVDGGNSSGGSSSGGGGLVCPTGFVKVPGNAAFSTAAQDFCLAKYEMKFASTSGQTQYTADGWKTWNWPASGTPAIASVPGTTPIATLMQSQAITACQSLGAGYHLVTNDEWMTAARSAESVTANWSGGAVGNGGMFRGNTGADDTLGCNDGGTDYVAAAGADNASLSNARSSCADKRQLKLANGEIVWDMAGNVWEHVNGANTLDGSNYATMPGNVCSATLNGWFSFAGTDGAGAGACSFTAPYSYAGYGPATAGMNASRGIGRIASYVTGGSSQVLLRGGNGSDGDYVGVFAMSSSWNSGNSGQYGGFRCAFR